jgi:hypothetical protein
MKSSKIIQELQKQEPYAEFLDENENENRVGTKKEMVESHEWKFMVRFPSPRREKLFI